MSDDSKIVSLDDVRQEKIVSDFLQYLKNRRQTNNVLALIGKKITFTAMGAGWGERGEDTLVIHFSAECGESSSRVGLLSISRSQWEELRTLGDQFFEGMREYSESKRKEEA